MPRRARTSPRRKSPSRARSLVSVQARLEPSQVDALRREAKRRTSGGRERADVSEVIREALSIWMAVRPGQRAIIRDIAKKQDLTRAEVLRKALDSWLTSLDPGEL